MRSRRRLWWYRRRAFGGKPCCGMTGTDGAVAGPIYITHWLGRIQSKSSRNFFPLSNRGRRGRSIVEQKV